jgi:acyl-coenzyme A thioesterase PaaI-like protein
LTPLPFQTISTVMTHGHIFAELGWNVRAVGDEVHGEADVIAALLVPGAERLRVSVLAAWADHLMGLVAAQIVAPRVPATLELDVQLLDPAPSTGRVRGRGRLLKSGRSVVFAAVDFFDARDRRFAIAGGSFMLAGDRNVRLPAKLSLDLPDQPAVLTMPFAQRAGCTLREPGVAVLQRREDGLNSSNTINGGLLALAAEEALRSRYEGHMLCSLALRYLRPCRVGPAVAIAERHGNLGVVEIRDDRLAVVGSARVF